MDLFWKTAAAALVAAILALALERQSKDFALILSLAVCTMITVAAAKLLKPVIDFFSRLEALGNLNNQMLLALMKIFGVGMAGELAGSVCNDAGNSSLARGLKFLTSAAILYLSIPVFSSLMDLFTQILGDV